MTNTTTTNPSTTEQTTNRASDSASTASDKAGSVASTAKDEAAGVAQDARQQARRLAGESRDQLRQQADQQAQRLSQTLRDIGGQLQGMANGDSAPTGPILGARVPDEGAKEALIADDPDVYFTTPHFDGYPAILVQLEHIDLEELEELLVEGWLCKAPKKLAATYRAAG